jgi:hypothetical protein
LLNYTLAAMWSTTATSLPSSPPISGFFLGAAMGAAADVKEEEEEEGGVGLEENPAPNSAGGPWRGVDGVERGVLEEDPAVAQPQIRNLGVGF